MVKIFGPICFFFVTALLPLVAFGMSVSVSISDTNLVVRAGDRLYFTGDIKYPENTTRQDLRIKYEVLQHQKVLAESNVLKAIETQMQFLDYIVIPISIQSGSAELRMTISDYGALHNAVSASFEAVEGNDQVRLYIFIIVMFVLCTSVASMIAIYFVKNTHREK